MEERHRQQLIQNLIERFDYLGDESFILDNEIAELSNPVTRESISAEDTKFIEQAFLDRIQYKRAHDSAVLVPVSVVADPRKHEEWYDEWIDKNNDNNGSYYWKRLENFLSHELSKKYGPNDAGRIVRSIDEATLSIMKKLANPKRNKFNYKGLVLGYVQSGKTANFTALISKAADAGYKFIIVLAGIHNVLRRQTQVRLDRELTGERDISGPDKYIELPGAAKTWNRLTTAHNDFSTDNLGMFSNFCQRETPTLAIVKKNVRVLEKLINYCQEASEKFRQNMPVLIIDDEADQASVDGNANDPDSDPTTTNERIRSLLSLFPRKAYVGYTATPFANVLIDMSTEHATLEDDLYPRNFIVSLPEPEGYFGTAMIFQGDLSDRFVQVTEDERNELIRHSEMTENLSEAVDQFIIACAIRNLRGHKLKPMSMLVHVSHKIHVMSVINNIIRKYVENIKGRYKDPNLLEILKIQLKGVFDKLIVDAIAINSDLSLENKVPDWEVIWEELSNVFEILQVMELNSSSDDTLDYTTGEEIKVIAVGGNQLSRGLTLEGLMTSYYLRASRQYDTLLQMGRWFGYRQGYEDLTRVHTTDQIWDFFEHLALVEEELRSEIYRYEEEKKTPVQMAVAIRDHRNLNVTAPNKMGAARLKQASYSGSLNQTIWLPLNQPEILRANYNLGDSFIQKISSRFGFANVNNGGVYLAKEKIEGEFILEEFLNKYNFVSKERTGGPGLDEESLLSYIFRRLNDNNSELSEWSFAVVGNSSQTKQNPTVKYGGLPINRIQRSRKYTERGFNIGVLTEPDHLTIDLAEGASRHSRSPHNPLLLLYLISKDSKAKIYQKNPRYDQRIDLFRYIDSEKIDILGLALELPQSKYEPNNYLGQ